MTPTVEELARKVILATPYSLGDSPKAFAERAVSLEISKTLGGIHDIDDEPVSDEYKLEILAAAIKELEGK